jgi:hypothetical protein
MKKERFYKLVIMLLVLLNAVTLSWLWVQGGEKKHGEGALEYLTQQLQLSREQQKKLNMLRTEHHEGNAGIRKNNRQLHDNFFDALKTNDSIQAEKLADSISVLHKKQELFTWYHFKKIRDLCTEEQKKKFDELIKETMFKMAPPPPGHIGPPPGRK